MSTQDDTTSKFKEALDRKNAQARQGRAHLDSDSKAHGAHGNASHQKQFRRKSG